MADDPRFTFFVPLHVSLVGSIAILVVCLPTGDGEPAAWQTILVLGWWPLISFAFSLVVIQRCLDSFKTQYAIAVDERDAWRSSTTESFRATTTTIIAIILGATPQVWWVVQLSSSKGVLIVPLGALLLLQCLLTAWSIAVLASTIAPGMRIAATIAYLAFVAVFVGNALLLRAIGNYVTLPYLGGNRIDGFSPLMLYAQRFVHDRPVSRLDLMYAVSLTMLATAGALLILLSRFIAFIRSRRTP